MGFFDKLKSVVNAVTGGTAGRHWRGLRSPVFSESHLPPKGGVALLHTLRCDS